MRAHLPVILTLFEYIKCLFQPNKQMKLYALTSTRIMNEILSLDMEGYSLSSQHRHTGEDMLSLC